MKPLESWTLFSEAKKDILNGNVRSILLIEDSPRMYSVILPLIYKEMVYQIQRLINQSLNQSQRLLHLRGRPKILLTPNYETAQKFFKQYKTNMMGIISDVRFLKGGEKFSNAGIVNEVVFALAVPFTYESKSPVLNDIAPLYILSPVAEARVNEVFDPS